MLYGCCKRADDGCQMLYVSQWDPNTYQMKRLPGNLWDIPALYAISVLLRLELRNLESLSSESLRLESLSLE